MLRIPILRARRLAGAVAVAALAAAPASAAIINVGNGTGCEASSFSSAFSMAFFSPEADEIRFSLADSNVVQVNSTVPISNFGPGGSGALTLSGGWSSCTDTVPDNAPMYFFFIGPAGGTFFEIGTSGGGTSIVTFRDIVVTSYLAAPDYLGVRLTGNSTLTLEDSSITLMKGGGVEVEGGAELVVDRDSGIGRNGPREEGGAIRCAGSGSRVDLQGSSSNNEAEIGGGIYATDGCEVELGGYSELQYNSATQGGAIAATDGASVTSTGGAYLQDNEATSSGGAIFAEGAATRVDLFSTRVRFSRAGFGGGAIYAGAGAEVTMRRGSCVAGTPFCISSIDSSELLPGGQQGSAAAAVNGALVDLKQTFVHGNSVDAEETDGSILYAGGAGAEVRTESVEISHNTGARRVVRAESGGSAQLAFTTVAYNTYVSAGSTVQAYGLRVLGSGSSAHVYSSIFHPTSGFQIAPEVTDTEFDCLVVQTALGLPPEATYVTVASPQYFTSQNLDLRPESPAVDFCDTTVYVPTVPDILGRTRWFDLGVNPNGNPGVPLATSVQDVGAYELRPLFSNGFGSGNSSQWSDVFP